MGRSFEVEAAEVFLRLLWSVPAEFYFLEAALHISYLKNCLAEHSKITFFLQNQHKLLASLPCFFLLWFMLNDLKRVIPNDFTITIYLFSKDVARESKINQLQYSFP